ncbi:uncharacterized protein BDV14DRAFT_45135 [Aspergillus stella-maris]|uniref:uncharacterized protein n=1 Tax=Aspergillus stella-maris TaxID=1810926 RepID=UPI003CCD43DB
MPPTPRPRPLHPLDLLSCRSSTLNSNLTTKSQPSTLPLPLSPRDTEYHKITGSGNTISIPSTYGGSTTSPNAGVIVGAVLGAVAGFLLLLYLLYLGLTSGRRFSASTIAGTSTTPSEIVDVRYRNRPPRGPWGRGSRVGRGGNGSEGQIIVEESLTSRSRSDGGGVVEVLEEESGVDMPPSSRSSSRTRSDQYRRRGVSHGRSRSGVRGVNPMAYGGGSEFSGRS